MAPEETPVRKGGSTGRVGYFGLTRDGGRKMHKGIDLLAPVGWPVYAMHDGTVSRAGWEDSTQQRKGYGRRIWLEGSSDTVTRYAHLSEILVAQGDVVDAGDLIGRTGQTGNASGTDPHLHIEVRVKGAPVDPLEWLIGGNS